MHPVAGAELDHRRHHGLAEVAPGIWCLRGQRVWNGQPGGGSSAEGMSPSSTMCSLTTLVSAIGTAESSASV